MLLLLQQLLRMTDAMLLMKLQREGGADELRLKSCAGLELFV
jgi:hypothetical protein